MAGSIERLVSNLKRSKLKKSVLRSLTRSMTTAAKIAAKTDFRVGHVTVALKDLKGWKAVRIINPYDKEPDIYQITDVGRKALSGLEKPVTKKGKRKERVFRKSGKRRSIS